MKRIIREYYEKLYANKLDNLEEKDKFLETHNLPRLNHEEIENFNRLTSSKEIESVVEKLANKQKPGTKWLHWSILPNI